MLKVKSQKLEVNNRGFTFPELAMVVGILVLLSTIVIVNLNIRGNKANSNNIKRRTDLESIQSALDLRAQETGESLPTGLVSGLIEQCVGTGSGCYNMTSDLVPLYLGSIPKDPKTGTDTDTGYYISVNATTKVVCLKAPGAENGETIENCRR